MCPALKGDFGTFIEVVIGSFLLRYLFRKEGKGLLLLAGINFYQIRMAFGKYALVLA